MTMGVWSWRAPEVNHVRLGHLVSDAITCEPVVDSPACIVDFRSLAALCPPSVTFWNIAMNVAEGIRKSSCQEVGKSSTFLVCKSR